MSNKFQKGFTTLNQELNDERLSLHGTLPTWLYGNLVRNGPAKFEVNGRNYRHWFDSLSMLHNFSFAEGQVVYTNKYLQSRGYEAAQNDGEIKYSEFATDPCRSIFQRVTSMFSLPEFSNNGNVNISKIADHFVAMTETPLATAFDLKTLETIGLVDYGDEIEGHITTAHPHYDATQQAGINYLLHYSRVSHYNIYALPVGKQQRRLIGSIPVETPAYMHSFGMTERYIILVEFPLVVNPLKMLMSGKPFIENYQWQPERGAQFLVMDKQTGDLVGRYETDAFFAFHHINAFEQGDEIVLDIAAFPDSTVVNALYLDRLNPTNQLTDFPQSELRRYRVDLSGSRVATKTISDEMIELPRINYQRHNTQDYQFAYGVSINRQEPDFLNQLIKVDVKNGQTKSWFASGQYPGEPVFVPAPQATEEDEGVILSVVLDVTEGTSFLLVLDAHTFMEIARAEVPHHLPFGFHGQFLSR